MQEVVVSVPFGFSTLGAPDANLEEIIKHEREAASTGFWGVIGTLEKIIKWLRYIAGIATVIIGAVTIVNTAEASTEAMHDIPVTKTAGIATCFGLNSAEAGVDEGLRTLSIPI